MLTLKILIAAGAVLIAYQDFKDRLISVWILAVFVSLLIAYGIISFSIYPFLNNVLISLAFLLLGAVIFMTYFGFIKKQSFSEIKGQIGAADVVLLIIPVFVLYSGDFLIFITMSVILCIIYYIFSMFVFRSGKAHFVPMAGLISIFIPIELQFEFCNKLLNNFLV